MEVLPAETETVQLTPPPGGPAPRGASPPAADPGDDPPAAADQVHPDRGGPGLLPGARPAAGRVREDARSPPLRPAPTPGLARLAAEEHVQPTEENPVIVFTLRPGVRFHDGQELTARDVKFTYETIVDPRNLSPRVSDFEPVKTVEIAGSRTVRVDLQRPFQPGFESWAMGILPEHLLNGRRSPPRRAGRAGSRQLHGAGLGLNRRPGRLGPVPLRRVAERRLDPARVRNDDYWEGPPNFREYLIRILPTLLTEELAFYARDGRQLHGPAAPGGAATGRPALPRELPPHPGLHLHRLQPPRGPLFQDVRVRTALGMAIDVDEIIRYVLYGQGERDTGPFPSRPSTTIRTSRPCPTTRRERPGSSPRPAGGRTPRGSWRRTASRSHSR